MQRTERPASSKGPKLGFLGFLSTFVYFLFSFCKPRGEDVLMEEGDLLVLRVTIGVSFAFPPLLNKSTRGSFCSFYFYSCVIVSLVLFNLCSSIFILCDCFFLR